MILDTNALSALADKDSALLEVISNASSLALPFVAYAEFRYGLLGSKRPAPGMQLLEQLACCIPLLLPDLKTIQQFSVIKDQLKRAGRPIPDDDIWIASLAVQHQMPVLSRDQRFDHITGIERVSW